MRNLTECKDCNHVVSKKAKTCPNCGVGNPANRTSVLTQLIVLVIVLAIGSDILTDRYENSEETAPISLEIQAKIIAKRVVKRLLKSPSTADFSGYADTQVGHLRDSGPNVWIVKGYVDAQNSFGAVIRNRYEVVIIFELPETGNDIVHKVESAELY